MRRLKWRVCFLLLLLASAALVAAGLMYFARRQAGALEVVREISEAEAISVALISYACQNTGNLPGGWDGLIASGIAKRSAEHVNGIEIVGETPRPHGTEVRDIGRYLVRFGLNAEEVAVDGDVVVTRSGEPVLLIAPAGESRIRNVYNVLSARVARGMKEGAARVQGN